MQAGVQQLNALDQYRERLEAAWPFALEEGEGGGGGGKETGRERDADRLSLQLRDHKKKGFCMSHFTSSNELCLTYE